MKILAKDYLEHIKQEINLEKGRRIVLVNTTETKMKNIPLSDHNANIYCLGENNQILWQVCSVTNRTQSDSFVYMVLEDDKLNANRFFGNEYDIDIKTGLAKHTGWNK